MYKIGTKKKAGVIVGFLLSLSCLFMGSESEATTVPTFQAESPLVVAYPARISQDANDNIYVADAREGAIVVFDKYNRKIKRITSVPMPYAVAAGPYGDIFIASMSGVVYRLDEAGEATQVIAGGNIGFPADMVIDSAGYFYIVDSRANEVKVFTAAGDFVRTFGGDGGTWYPTAVALGSDPLNDEELVYVGYSAEWIYANNTSMVMAYDINGAVVRSFGVPHLDNNAPAPDAIKRVTGLTLDDKGRVYVADSYGDRVTVFDDLGVHLTVLPAGTIPVAIFYDSFGRLFISTGVGIVSVFSVDGAGVPNAVPSAPEVVSPVNGESVATLMPTLVAGNSSDLNNDGLVYDFVVASDAGMSNVVWSAKDVPEGAEGQTSVVVDQALLEDNLYYWTAKSFDGVEYSRDSQVASFFVNTVNSEPFIEALVPSESEFYVLPGTSETLSVDARDTD
ncbi:MAG: NHL repeat-containing protein, partial [Thermodesulfovibrionia bacterium]|nr:NHL repeat-containing protein [Thermodesulfovibrionia bacterium]